ncbi:MAG: TAT-variant-translocated molybdopterin oxidoreductase [Planctomycetota bacterium]
MSTIDQCPSTRDSVEIPEAASPLPAESGRKHWRSVEEFAGSPGFKDWVEREFPAGASELTSNTDAGRRDALKLMAASFALAGAALVPGCRRPDHKIFSYSASEPEHSIPGKPLYFATSLPTTDGVEGLLVETHQQRPTKIEGNPLHPANRGRSSARAQGEILRLYDPDRLKEVRVRVADGEKRDATWDDFTETEGQGLRRLREVHGSTGDRGRGLAVIAASRPSPTLRAMRDRLYTAYPQSAFAWWEPLDTARNQRLGTELAIGRPRHVRLNLERAACVLSLASDFTDRGEDHIRHAREFAKTRRVENAGDEMSRLYVAEPMPTPTGSLADHRYAMPPQAVSALAVEVARRVLDAGPLRRMVSSLPELDVALLEDAGVTGEMVDMIAQDLLEHAAQRPGSSLVVCGDDQPAEIHALTAAINESLGALGTTVEYAPLPSEIEADPFAGLAEVAARIRRGEITTLVVVGANPVYDAPAELGFAELFESVEETIVLDSNMSETVAAARWELKGAGPLESWGDSRALDGTIAPVQPMIAPLFAPALSEIEFLAMLAGQREPNGYELVRETWGGIAGAAPGTDRFDRIWRRALHDGVLSPSTFPSATSRVNPLRIEDAMSAFSIESPAEGELTAVFTTSHVGDGAYANCGWLQELPHFGTQVCWDNPAVVSPATAERLGLLPVGLSSDEGDLDAAYTRGQIPRARVATVRIPDGAGGTLETEMPVWIMPGAADGVVQLTHGYGRTEVGLVGREVGVSTYPLRTAANRSGVAGATLERVAGETFEIVSTQNHWSLESRTSIARALDKRWFDGHASGGRIEDKDKIYGTKRKDGGLNLAEQLGELTHTPDNVSIYTNPQNRSKANYPPPAEGQPFLSQPDFAKPPQWGMTIDLSTCNGCSLCTVACQAENNIAIVGKTEVAKGREMTWIRVDRYFVGDDLNHPDEMLNQPVACVHCENAPCEVVCPVNATVHGPEGTNNMAYNRCIGTRYCANNCPYKARRFNFFDYSQARYNGSFVGEETVFGEDGVDQRGFNKNFIPPRLREQISEIEHMKMNPDVTVRGRGVMEKCTYCIQRINAARQESKVRGIWDDPAQTAPIPDGMFQVACQQACPSESIVFGDILDPDSAVAATRDSQRSYLLLGYLNTRPRTSHMLRVRNPNRPLLEAEWGRRRELGIVSEAAYEDRMSDPLAGHGGGYGGDDHGGEDGGDAHSYFSDPSKRNEDRGYAMSLRVLGGSSMGVLS